MPLPKTLEAIAEWLESKSPPDPPTAKVLFEEVIPAAVDAAVGDLHLRSVSLLRRAHELAELKYAALEAAVHAMTGTPSCPPTCAECGDAKHFYNFGEHQLRCWEGELDDDEKRKRPLLTVVEGDVAFRQPTSVSHAQLREQIVSQEPPGWCPRR